MLHTAYLPANIGFDTAENEPFNIRQKVGNILPNLCKTLVKFAKKKDKCCQIWQRVEVQRVRYEGQWVNGKQHGRGYFVKKDGTSNLADWENGQRVNWVVE